MSNRTYNNGNLMLEPLKLVIPSEHPMFVKEEDIIGAVLLIRLQGFTAEILFHGSTPCGRGGGEHSSKCSI